MSQNTNPKAHFGALSLLRMIFVVLVLYQLIKGYSVPLSSMLWRSGITTIQVFLAILALVVVLGGIVLVMEKSGPRIKRFINWVDRRADSSSVFARGTQITVAMVLIVFFGFVGATLVNAWHQSERNVADANQCSIAALAKAEKDFPSEKGLTAWDSDTSTRGSSVVRFDDRNYACVITIKGSEGQRLGQYSVMVNTREHTFAVDRE